MVNWFGIGEDDMREDEQTVEYQELSGDDEPGQIAVDILDSEQSITIIAPIAGIELEDIDVSLNNSILTISGKRQKPDIYKQDDITLRNNECFWGKFTRNIILPDNLDFDSVKATMENSLLMVSISKLNFSSQRIKVENLDD